MNILRHLTVAALLICALPPASANPGPTAPMEGPPSNNEWRLIGGGAYEQHYSPIKQVNDATVATLGLAWYADMPTTDGLTGVPLIADGVVYQSGALGKVWANDLETGKLLWSYDAQIKFPTGLVASWGARLSRGLALWENTVLKATGDCRLIALDRRTGALRWQAQSCDPLQYKTITGAPRVGAGKVFIGNSNADSGIGRGYVDAYDIATGRHLWRFYTIPGDPAQPFESSAMEMASKTWGKEYWKHSGGGSPWEGITYDATTNLVYIGTDGPAPFAPTMRDSNGGDELFTNAIVAVNADTGAYVWHYSTTPRDGWNYAATNPVVLADLAIGGAQRHVIMIAPKNGFFYLLDARNGKLVNEPKPILPVNWASRIDMQTGRPVLTEAAKYWEKGKEGAVVSPSPMGAHNWMPMSYSPQTGLVYIPVTDYPARASIDSANSVGRLDIDFYYALTHHLPFKGTLLAWDPVKQESRWSHDVGPPYEGGTLATAGNLVFQGTTTGTFNAYRADTGEKVWSYPTASGILGAPSTVEVGGRQYILVAAGSGTTSAVGFAPRFSGRAAGPPRLLAFALNGSAKLPAADAQPSTFPLPPAPLADAAVVDRGKAIWYENGCELCHGVGVVGGLGSVGDLRRTNAATYKIFAAIVRGGLFKDAGMPVFADTITDEDLPALKAYLISTAWQAYREAPQAPPAK